MSSPLPRRRSLALLAVLAFLMVGLSYVFILIMAAACAYLPYLLLMSSGSPNLQILLLLLCGLGMSGAMLWSLVPRRDDFKEPGPEIDTSAHPRLFSELEKIATALNEPMPEQVFLIPQVNAFVTDRGGIMGFGARRVMGVGLPLIAVLNVSELRAVLAHEFAHFYGGDTRLGPFVYKTRVAMIRTIQNLASMRGVMRVAIAALVYGMVMWIVQAYWRAFFRATQLISRKQEYRADELASLIAGPDSLINGLKKIHGANAAFPAYWNLEVLPFLAKGYRLPVTEGFEFFVTASEISRQMQEYVEKELNQAKTSPYDSHPPLRDRIRALKTLAATEASTDSSLPARTLFGDLLAEEARILKMSGLESQVSTLKPLKWDELPAVLPKLWSDTVNSNAQLLGDLTPEGIPDVVSKLPEIGSRIPDPKGMLLTPEQRTGRAVELIGAALALAIVSAGWELHMKPGDRYYQLGIERFSVRDFVGQLLAKKISREQWIERCEMLNITGVRLAAGQESRQMAMFQIEGKS